MTPSRGAPDLACGSVTRADGRRVHTPSSRCHALFAAWVIGVGAWRERERSRRSVRKGPRFAASFSKRGNRRASGRLARRGPGDSTPEPPAWVNAPPGCSSGHGPIEKAGSKSVTSTPARTPTLTVMRTGYARRVYGQRVEKGNVPPLALTAGDEKDLAIRLTPTGNVSGGCSRQRRAGPSQVWESGWSGAHTR